MRSNNSATADPAMTVQQSAQTFRALRALGQRQLHGCDKENTQITNELDCDR